MRGNDDCARSYDFSIFDSMLPQNSRKQADKQSIYKNATLDRNLLFWRVYTTLLVDVEGISVFDWPSTFAVRLMAQFMVIVGEFLLLGHILKIS